MSPIKALWDLILENGEYRVGVRLDRADGDFNGKRIVHALQIRGVYQWPWLGTLLRNFWAKRKGAVLFSLPPKNP